MATTHKPTSPLHQRMIEEMRLRKLGEKTQQVYLRAVRSFTVFLGHAPDTPTAKDLRRYQLALAERGCRRSRSMRY